MRACVVNPLLRGAGVADDVGHVAAIPDVAGRGHDGGMAVAVGFAVEGV